MRIAIRRALSGAFILVAIALDGCTASQQQAASALVSDVAPIAASVVNGAFPAIAPVLTLVAQQACADQAAANATNDAVVSALAGAACKW